MYLFLSHWIHTCVETISRELLKDLLDSLVDMKCWCWWNSRCHGWLIRALRSGAEQDLWSDDAGSCRMQVFFLIFPPTGDVRQAFVTYDYVCLDTRCTSFKNPAFTPLAKLVYLNALQHDVVNNLHTHKHWCLANPYSRIYLLTSIRPLDMRHCTIITLAIMNFLKCSFSNGK